MTLFGSYNALFQNLNDNDGITSAQIVAFGKNYALQTTNPAAGNYAPYNHVHKKTDMDYMRLQGDLGNGFAIDNTLYTYDLSQQDPEHAFDPADRGQYRGGHHPRATAPSSTVFPSRTTFRVTPSRTPSASMATSFAVPRISTSAG